MKLVVLGLTLSSSWGNGHATTFRALLSAFAARGHEILFLERDKPWYADHRDLAEPDFCRLEFYDSVPQLERWRPWLEQADAVIVGSYVPDGIAVGAWAQGIARGRTCFYDIDTPVTLAALERGTCEYLTPGLIPGYATYFSFTGGTTLARLEQAWGSPRARPLYCAVDTARYRPLAVPKRWDLTYLGTYSDDRQPTLARLLIDVAAACPNRRFAVAGPQYPGTIRWPANVERIEHLPPTDHPEFYSASRYTLNVTRADMVRAGWSPSVRLFEAGACACPIISDRWEGIGSVMDGIRIAETGADVIAALGEVSPAFGEAARASVLARHSAAVRAGELEADLLALAAAMPA